ncbi:OLC1v1018233C1 [Oldenlandia corymbosa var. corymbosa]|uniref:OLC1v1018233C1 n=1 Tax=Oldenlandia corymbosa var. corymbosa TaxID=529605 RepID=A0AAV1EB47_OLDCO|nr:OLC1v1018233C1 [Oldenlandia corymbosa var. corymbosa]
MDNPEPVPMLRERRPGISWRDQTLASLSAPPLPLMVIFGVVVLLLYLATSSDYKSQVEKSLAGFKVLLFLLPLVLILVVHVMMVSERWLNNLRYSRLFGAPEGGGGGSPVLLLLVVVGLLVLVYYHSLIKSSWFHPV